MVRALPVLVLVVLLLAVVPAAFAQGCAMCRTAAGTVDQPAQSALNLAILVLLIPTTSIFAGVLFWAYRKRNRSWNETFPAREHNTDPFTPESEEASSGAFSNNGRRGCRPGS